LIKYVVLLQLIAESVRRDRDGKRLNMGLMSNALVLLAGVSIRKFLCARNYSCKDIAAENSYSKLRQGSRERKEIRNAVRKTISIESNGTLTFKPTKGSLFTRELGFGPKRFVIRSSSALLSRSSFPKYNKQFGLRGQFSCLLWSSFSQTREWRR